MCRKTHNAIVKLLEATDLPYAIEQGSRHDKIKLNGKLVGILPRGGTVKSGANVRAMKNVESQIRRAAKEMKEAA